MKSWSLQFFLRYRGCLSFWSRIRLWFFSVAKGRGAQSFNSTIALRLRQPYSSRVMLRPVSNDLYTFDEIFVDKVYLKVVENLRAPDYVIDAGANIGLATVFLKGHHKGLKRVICVEPDSCNADLMNFNLENLISQGFVRIYRGALWGDDSNVCLGPMEQGHVNQRSCLPLDVATQNDENSIPAYTVRSLMEREGMPYIDLLKMDIEGGEISVFSGDVSWLVNVRMLAIEFHGCSRRQIGFDEIMNKYGFTIIYEEMNHTVIALKRPVAGKNDNE